MKKLLIFLFLTTLWNLQIFSQQLKNTSNSSFTPYKCEVGSFMGLSKDNEYGFGLGMYLHPSYFINDNLNIGFKGESSLILKADFADFVSYLATFQVTSRYYFSTDAIRMYAELGTGVHVLYSSSPKKFLFGLSPKIGLDLEMFSLFVSYNYIIEQEPFDKSHLTIGAGFFLGGRKEK